MQPILEEVISQQEDQEKLIALINQKPQLRKKVVAAKIKKKQAQKKVQQLSERIENVLGTGIMLTGNLQQQIEEIKQLIQEGVLSGEVVEEVQKLEEEVQDIMELEEEVQEEIQQLQEEVQQNQEKIQPSEPLVDPEVQQDTTLT